jgi:hypothetical protein
VEEWEKVSFPELVIEGNEASSYPLRQTIWFLLLARYDKMFWEHFVGWFAFTVWRDKETR